MNTSFFIVTSGLRLPDAVKTMMNLREIVVRDLTEEAPVSTINRWELFDRIYANSLAIEASNACITGVHPSWIHHIRGIRGFIVLHIGDECECNCDIYVDSRDVIAMDSVNIVHEIACRMKYWIGQNDI